MKKNQRELTAEESAEFHDFTGIGVLEKALKQLPKSRVGSKAEELEEGKKVINLVDSDSDEEVNKRYKEQVKEADREGGGPREVDMGADKVLMEWIGFNAEKVEEKFEEKVKRGHKRRLAQLRTINEEMFKASDKKLENMTPMELINEREKAHKKMRFIDELLKVLD